MVENEPCVIKSTERSKSGKHGHAKVRLSAVGILDNKKRIIVMPGHDHVEVPIIDKRTAQVLSVQGNKVNVMDSESYVTMDLDIPEELKGKIVNGASVLYWDIMGDKVIKQVKGN